MAEHAGLKPVQCTRQIRVDVPSDLPGAFAAEYLRDDPAAIGAWRDWYIAGHVWDPPQPQPEKFWADMAADTRHVVGVTDQHRLTGIGHLYIDGGQSWFVGGALDRDSPEAAGIAAGLLRSARHLIGDRLQVELDDWMTDVVSIIHTLDHVVLDEALIVMGHPAREHDHESPANS